MRYDDNSLRMLTDEVSKRLSGDRFTHTIGVSKMAQKLALVFSLDATVAAAAALLHDITKEYSYEEGLSLLREGGISLDKEDLDTPSILHSFTAEVVIKRDFPDFSDEDVLSAVRNHTIGSPLMNTLDKIIFLSDFIEEGRKYDSSRKLRLLVESGITKDSESNIKLLNEACVLAIDATLSHLISEKRKINSKNVLTRNSLLDKI